MAKFLQHLIDSLQGKKNSCRPNTQFKVQVNGLHEAGNQSKDNKYR